MSTLRALCGALLGVLCLLALPADTGASSRCADGDGPAALGLAGHCLDCEDVSACTDRTCGSCMQPVTPGMERVTSRGPGRAHLAALAVALDPGVLLPDGRPCAASARRIDPRSCRASARLRHTVLRC